MTDAVIKDRSPGAIARRIAAGKTDPWTVLDALRQNLSAARVLSPKQKRNAHNKVGELHSLCKREQLTLDQAIDELERYFDDF